MKEKRGNTENQEKGNKKFKNCALVVYQHFVAVRINKERVGTASVNIQSYKDDRNGKEKH